MSYDEIKSKAENYLSKELESVWKGYTEREKQKMIVGFIFGYNEATIEQIKKAMNDIAFKK